MLKNKLISSAVGIMVFFSVFAHQAPNPNNDSERRSFVVIAAFNLHYNAKRYTEYVRKMDLNAEYAFNRQRQLYYVYAMVSTQDDQAKDMVWKLREKEDFGDAWVFRGKLLEGQDVPQIVKVDLPPDISTVTSENTYPSADNNATKTSEKTDSGSTVKKSTQTSTSIPSSKEIKEEVTIKEPVIKEKYKLYVNTINVDKFKEVHGTVDIRDHQRDKKLKTVPSHKLFGMNDPNNGNHSIRIVSTMFGYRPTEKIIDLTEPVNDSTSAFVETIGDSIIVNMDLERLRKGEIAVMWNVYYFKDAAIMRPESRSELNSLLNMLKENSKLKIMIHGHTNGGSTGKILHLNLEDTEFFTLSGNHIEDVGSAKKLSEYRAFTIQHYLIAQGIDESRMEIKGWGGKKMLYDKHDPQARKNVRVEVEILEI